MFQIQFLLNDVAVVIFIIFAVVAAIVAAADTITSSRVVGVVILVSLALHLQYLSLHPLSSCLRSPLQSSHHF